MQNSRKGARRSRQVSDLLKPGRSPLGRLLTVARELDRLDRLLANLLDPAMAADVQVAALRDNRLVLVTSSAALATRLRLDSGQLVQSLNAAGEKHIREIDVRVAPVARRTAVHRRRRELPEIAKQSLERFAADSGDDEIEAIVRRPNTRRTGE